jgi:hypothetical protein
MVPKYEPSTASSFTNALGFRMVFSLILHRFVDGLNKKAKKERNAAYAVT